MSNHPMPHADAAWLRMGNATNQMVINCLMWFDETPDWERLRTNHIERIVELFPRFQQLARAGGALSSARWEDDPDFDPQSHFHRSAVPAPHDRTALSELIGDLASAPLDHDRPLWEMHLIDDFGSGAAMLMRIHHAVGDGMALARVMLSATDGGDPGPGIGEPGPQPSALSAALDQGLGALDQGLGAIRHPRKTAARGRADLGALAKLLLPGSESSPVLKGEGEVANRVAWSDPVDLRCVKHTARAYRVTLNDVLLGALAGALREHMTDAGAPSERLHALVPVNLRPLDQPLARTLGNQFGLVLAGLPTDVDDQIDRLWEVNRHMNAIKNSDEGVITYGMLDMMGRTPAEVEARLIDYITAKASMVVTNVQGPPEQVSLAGTPLAGVLVWAPCSGKVRMSVGIVSYGGEVTAGFLADAGVVPDTQPLADAFRTELLALGRRSQNVVEMAR